MTKYLKKNSIIVASLIIGFSGCTMKNQTADLSNQKIIELQKELEIKNTKISELEAKNTNKENDTLLPFNAKAGECYAKVLVPEQYETKEIKQLVKEAETKIEIVPATYKTVEKKVTIREESSKLELVPATYKTITESIMIEPEKTILTTVPATYKTVTEKVLIKPAHTIWKKGRGEIEKVDNSTGEILCLVEVPAVYETISKQILDTPATTKEVKIPAIYKTVEKRVIDTPATTKEIKIPAICKIVSAKEIDTPAKEIKTEIPAVYTMVPTKVKVSDSYFKWQSILCETNTNKDIISNLQKELKSRNYNISKINGEYNEETKEAVKAYQRDKKLNQGALTIETLKSLGL